MRKPFPDAEGAALERQIEPGPTFARGLLGQMAHQGDLDQAARPVDGLELDRRRAPRLGVVGREGADDGPVVRVDRRRPAGPQAVAERELAERGPQRVRVDVGHDHLSVLERGGAAGTDGGADGDAIDGGAVWRRQAWRAAVTQLPAGRVE